jgi:hypothetical protein
VRAKGSARSKVLHADAAQAPPVQWWVMKDLHRNKTMSSLDRSEKNVGFGMAQEVPKSFMPTRPRLRLCNGGS